MGTLLHLHIVSIAFYFPNVISKRIALVFVPGSIESFPNVD